jgi:hypothetical protein
VEITEAGVKAPQASGPLKPPAFVSGYIESLVRVNGGIYERVGEGPYKFGLSPPPEVQ